MLQPKANHRERSVLWRCVMLLAALGMPTVGVIAAAATFGADGTREVAILDDVALEALASPVALYPDELLAIVLPAATFPLQIVQAARFLQARQGDPTLEPDASWDDTIVALLNYPEVLALLDTDLAWTERLGDAVITQEAALMRAISQFRERAYIAGNLRSDERQRVSRNAEVIVINTAAADTVYVPYYNPSAVILPQPAPVYHYYSNPYPLYYYPYTPQQHYLSSAFWGLTTAYTLGWATNRIRFHRHGYDSHPYSHERYFRPRYRDRAAHGPRSAFNPRHRYPSNYAGDAWRNGRREAYARHSARKPARVARDPHPSDRIRVRRGATPGAVARDGRPAPTGHRIKPGQHRQGTGNNTGFRANNGLLGNGALARPQALTKASGRKPPNRGSAAVGPGANARSSSVAANPSVSTRHPGTATTVVPRQTEAQAFVDQRRESRSRAAPEANRHATDGRRSRRPARNTRPAQSRHSDRAASTGISSRANAAANPRTRGNAYRGGPAGGRTRAGGFLGNGSRAQR
ncbi:MAG: DUF3300 domain-containing protein [Gammaproteobacteria bacterium]|jgi:hypothetical protein